MRALLVASTGGHLLELAAWAERIPGISARVWATAESAQSKALLAEEDVRWIPDIPSRDYRGTMAVLPAARRILADGDYDIVISTGAAVAIGFFVAARMAGVRAHYIESATRLNGPSLTGQVAALMPGVSCYTQSRSWEDSRWKYAGSVFEGYSAVPTEPPTGPLRVVVTLGSMYFPMPRLVEQLNEQLPDDAEVVWQLGHTPAIPNMKGVRVEQFISHNELADAMAAADVVVCHAGVGSALTAMAAGRLPIVVPREESRGEHIDDHQAEIAAGLESLGLAISRSPDEVSLSVLLAAASQSVTSTSSPAPLTLKKARRRRNTSPYASVPQSREETTSRAMARESR
jgi:UDP-N-acetylglucosamine--N-acetylmuramyl-(pentapeptide) pyrophosphoryl-undecaprenol N-acetylglucosamine transferase